MNCVEYSKTVSPGDKVDVWDYNKREVAKGEGTLIKIHPHCIAPRFMVRIDGTVFHCLYNPLQGCMEQVEQRLLDDRH